MLVQIDESRHDNQARASIVCFPSRGPLEITAIFPLRIPTFRTASSPDSGSITRPLAMTTS